VGGLSAAEAPRSLPEASGHQPAAVLDDGRANTNSIHISAPGQTAGDAEPDAKHAPSDSPTPTANEIQIEVTPLK